MTLLCGQRNRIWYYWCGKYPGSVGLLVSPSYLSMIPLDKWMPFALDNGAYIAWSQGKPWDLEAWRDMLKHVKQRFLTPLWVAVPDAVGDRKATILKWNVHAEEVMKLGWRTAFCVQDGMTPRDVPSQADVVFVGGTDGWKFPNLPMWAENFPHVHCARVNAPEMIEACERVGCKSIDGTGWFRDPSRDDKLPALERFVEGHRASDQPMLFTDTD